LAAACAASIGRAVVLEVPFTGSGVRFIAGVDGLAATVAAGLDAVEAWGLVSWRAVLAASAGRTVSDALAAAEAWEDDSDALPAGFFAAGGLLAVTGAAFARCLVAATGSALPGLAVAAPAPPALVSLVLACLTLALAVVPPVPRPATADVGAAFMLDTSYPSL